MTTHANSSRDEDVRLCWNESNICIQDTTSLDVFAHEICYRTTASITSVGIVSFTKPPEIHTRSTKSHRIRQ